MQTAEKTGLVNTEEFFTIRTVATATKKVQLAVAPVLVSAAGGKKMDLSSITAVKDKTVKFVKGQDTTEYGENTFEAKVSKLLLLTLMSSLSMLVYRYRGACSSSSYWSCDLLCFAMLGMALIGILA